MSTLHQHSTHGQKKFLESYITKVLYNQSVYSSPKKLYNQSVYSVPIQHTWSEKVSWRTHRISNLPTLIHADNSNVKDCRLRKFLIEQLANLQNAGILLIIEKEPLNLNYINVAIFFKKLCHKSKTYTCTICVRALFDKLTIWGRFARVQGSRSLVFQLLK